MQDPSLWRTAAYIRGRWIEPGALGAYPIRNPASGQVLAEVSRCGESETQAAIEAASDAFDSWKRETAKVRSEALRRWYELIIRNREDLASIITLEEGKPLVEARGEVDYAASFVQWYSEEAKRVNGDVIPAPRGETRLVVVKEPVGVCGAITPWNFPAAMITRKAAPALAAGCTMIVKPAEATPLTALALAELGERAGFPPGVFNVVTGAHEDASTIGRVLTNSDVVRKLTFTGSTAVGRMLLAQAAGTIKKVSMELGGNAPFIVFADADVSSAVDGLMLAKFRNSGQSCIGANRILVHADIHDRFVDEFARRAKRLTVGDGFEPRTDLGPLINAGAVAKLESHISDAIAKGAHVVCGGGRHLAGPLFFEPTILSGCTAGMRLAQDESFGPLAPIFRFVSEREAVDLANQTPFGLAAYIYTESASTIWRVTSALETGMVGVNCGFISNEVAPFGGVKQSGLGREGARYGIEEFLETKYLCWDIRAR